MGALQRDVLHARLRVAQLHGALGLAVGQSGQARHGRYDRQLFLLPRLLALLFVARRPTGHHRLYASAHGAARAHHRPFGYARGHRIPGCGHRSRRGRVGRAGRGVAGRYGDRGLGVLGLEVHHALVGAKVADRRVGHGQVVLGLRVLLAEVAVYAPRRDCVYRDLRTCECFRLFEGGCY